MRVLHGAPRREIPRAPRPPTPLHGRCPLTRVRCLPGAFFQVRALRARDIACSLRAAAVLDPDDVHT